MPQSDVDALLASAARARDGWDKTDAVRLYSDALDLEGEDGTARRRIRLLRGVVLVEAGDLEAGVAEIGDLLPDLVGRDEIDALLSLGHAMMWMERNDEAHALAERSLALAESLGDAEMRGPSLALLSQSLGQRGDEGDLGSAIAVGDLALDVWVRDVRRGDLALHASLHALNHYWAGSYARAAELGERGRTLGEDVCNAQAHLDGSSTEALALTALGRTEEAMDLFDATIARARELEEVSSIAYALACSTSALRDLLLLDESRRRSRETIELFGRVDFESGMMQGEMDLLYADLAGGEVDRAERAWPQLWDRARNASGWERWIAPGRLAVARAEMALSAEHPEAAVEHALEAITIAKRIARPKYDVAARITLGAALLELDRREESVSELERAVSGADGLGHPPTRWKARATLGRALYATGNDGGAATRSAEAADLIRGFAAPLSPERAEPLLTSRSVQDVLRAG